MKKNNGSRTSNGRTTTAAKGTTTKTKYPLNVNQKDLYEMIRKKAFELYCKRDPHSGDAIGDWVAAERIVKSELGLRS